MAHNFLTVAEVADELRVTPKTVLGWISGGVLPAVKVGKSYRIRNVDLDSLIEVSTTGSRPE